MVSAGKDSSVLGHLVASLDPSVEWVSEKDDLDYPGEREYVTALAGRCGSPLTIVEPPFSVWARFAELAPTLGAWEDIHGRAAALSHEAFYGVVEPATRGRPIFLGLRAEESRGRAMNRYSRGLTYTKRSGQTVCQPLGDWRALDVYAYAAAHDIPLLPVYQCVALMHRYDPSRVRKSWWVGGAANAHGHVRWLAHYWPSLFARLCSVMPQVRAMT
jgi:3'-phosphoadenosine 5'-phosphosulfate sulfotransferase (PAPS reductase)/FAD synthetase